MGKRKVDETETEYIKRKLRKMEKKLRKMEEETSHSSQTPPTLVASVASGEIPTEEEVIGVDQTTEEDDGLPEEFLLALGTEGEDNEEKGTEIRPELAARWLKLMSAGLSREDLEKIIKKYPTPINFCSEAPKVNPEISASLSEISLKRDKRIVQRQNLILKVMCALGRTLTDVLKGNINSSSIIENVNDAAKLCSMIFYEDSSSRKFFALAGANQTIKEAVKDAKADEFLFGKDCAEKIKAAQTIKKTGNQIKNPETSTNKNPNLPKQPKRQGNWRGPPQSQQQRSRGGHRQATTTKKYQHYQTHHRDQKRNQYRNRHTYRR